MNSAFFHGHKHHAGQCRSDREDQRGKADQQDCREFRVRHCGRSGSPDRAGPVSDQQEAEAEPHRRAHGGVTREFKHERDTRAMLRFFLGLSFGVDAASAELSIIGTSSGSAPRGPRPRGPRRIPIVATASSGRSRRLVPSRQDRAVAVGLKPLGPCMALPLLSLSGRNVAAFPVFQSRSLAAKRKINRR